MPLKITCRFPQLPAGQAEPLFRSPVIRVNVGKEQFYISGFGSFDQLSMADVSLISADGCITGHITMRNLDRLGNANFATPSTSTSPAKPSTFPKATF